MQTLWEGCANKQESLVLNPLSPQAILSLPSTQAIRGLLGTSDSCLDLLVLPRSEGHPATPSKPPGCGNGGRGGGHPCHPPSAPSAITH